jgi:hypothetical protein
MSIEVRLVKRHLLANFLLMLVLIGSPPAMADENVVNRWYAVLLAANIDSLSALLANSAKIKLDDLGVEQTKAEFLDSMEEWKVAAASAAIRHRVESTEGAVTTVLACYDFAENDMLIRETFTIRNGLIFENTQTQVDDDCNAF